MRPAMWWWERWSERVLSLGPSDAEWCSKWVAACGRSHRSASGAAL